MHKKKVNEIVENYHSNPRYCKHEQMDKEFHNKPSLFVNDKWQQKSKLSIG